MSQVLVPGQNCPVPLDILQIVVTTGTASNVSIFRLYANGKIRLDDDFIFYGKTVNDDNTVIFTQNGTVSSCAVDLQRMKQDVEKITFCITADAQGIAALQHINLEIFQAGKSLLKCMVDLAGRTEAALILGEIYKRSGAWKFRSVMQGFDGGLKPLAEFFGVNTSSGTLFNSEASPAPTVNLSKVTLTKEAPRVDLKKRDTRDGLFKVNLNWSQGDTGEQEKTGFWQGLFGRSKVKEAIGIDLDLAAYISLQNGGRTIVQALGNKFGSLAQEPYVQLQGDDRTGAQSDGEWIHINNKKFDLIEEVLIFTFIYEGVPNWNATDAVVTIHIPGQPEIQTRLTEGNDTLRMCAIARISNYHGDVRIERINRYFSAHDEMDKAFGWGFKWVGATK